ncbi:hypothetical protein QQF64_020423 [Cirrhinus molitorella]|uniref:Uncharacterized protein n=1 Tax=Cirrhinus molitorella TaxID=172907 RepID=A0ABR3L9E1_9TELE
MLDTGSMSCTLSEAVEQKLLAENAVLDRKALPKNIILVGVGDCGEAKEFEHCIRLTDDRPFRLPYRRIHPAHYQKLRQVLTEMEEQGIIRKSVSEYASPLVLVWKKDGSLCICADFRWLNARTLKDAHPLPHQFVCLAALGVKSLGAILFLGQLASPWDSTKTSLGKRPQLQITRKSIQRRTVTKQRPKALKPVPVIQFSSRSFPKDVIADRSPTNQEPHRSYAEAETQSK